MRGNHLDQSVEYMADQEEFTTRVGLVFAPWLSIIVFAPWLSSCLWHGLQVLKKFVLYTLPLSAFYTLPYLSEYYSWMMLLTNDTFTWKDRLRLELSHTMIKRQCTPFLETWNWMAWFHAPDEGIQKDIPYRQLTKGNRQNSTFSSYDSKIRGGERWTCWEQTPLHNLSVKGFGPQGNWRQGNSP